MGATMPFMDPSGRASFVVDLGSRARRVPGEGHALLWQYFDELED